VFISIADLDRHPNRCNAIIPKAAGSRAMPRMSGKKQ
jgi:hypothetical protein